MTFTAAAEVGADVSAKTTVSDVIIAAVVAHEIFA